MKDMEKLEQTARLTPEEKRQAALYAGGDWALLSRDGLTRLQTWIRRDGNKLHVREVQPVTDIVDQAARMRSAWTGWHDKKHAVGAIVAALPLPVYRRMMTACGYQNGAYDTRKYRRLLNDGDYSKFKTIDGKI